jgi:hypothetical protein
MRATCPTHLTLLDLITLTILDEEYRLCGSSLCNSLHDPSSPLLDPNIYLNTLFSKTLRVRDKVPRPYNTTVKITKLQF